MGKVDSFMCYFNCRILLVLSAVAIMGAAGHAQSVLKTADYKVNQELDMPGAHLLAFRESHNLNMMGNLQWSGKAKLKGLPPAIHRKQALDAA